MRTPCPWPMMNSVANISYLGKRYSRHFIIHIYTYIFIYTHTHTRWLKMECGKHLALNTLALIIHFQTQKTKRVSLNVHRCPRKRMTEKDSRTHTHWSLFVLRAWFYLCFTFPTAVCLLILYTGFSLLNYFLFFPWAEKEIPRLNCTISRSPHY